MSKKQPRFRSVRRPFTPEEKKRFAKAKTEVAEQMPQLTKRAKVAKAQMLEARHAMQLLKQAREDHHLSLADVCERSGIDRSNLSKLENDPNANPTLDTLARIAQAIGVTLRIDITDEAA
jgi:DNA-binding phage protein